MVNNIIWAHGYWNFFHTLSYNLNEKKLNSKNLNLIHIFINNLIMSIPCEKCKIDTVQYFENNNFKNINTKKQFIHFFYLFHNYVNYKTRKDAVKLCIIHKYKNLNVIEYLRIIDNHIFNNTLNKRVYNFFYIITKND